MREIDCARVLAFAITMLMSLASAPLARAQAWVDEKGSLGVALAYQFDTSSRILESDGLYFDDEQVRIHSIMVATEFTPISRLAVRAQLPLMFLSWDNTNLEGVFAGHGPADDGSTNTVVQDLRIDARYAVLEEFLVVTPLLGFSVPTSDYERIGFTAAGRRLRQLHLGLAVARTLDPLVPNLYFQGYYELTVAESVDVTPATEDVGQSLSRAGLDVGYFLGERVSIFAAANAAFYHDGIDYVDYPSLSGDLKDFHDLVLKERAIFVGGGVGFRLSEALAVGVAFRQLVSGRNTRNSSIATADLSWSTSLFEASAAND